MMLKKEKKRQHFYPTLPYLYLRQVLGLAGEEIHLGLIALIEGLGHAGAPERGHADVHRTAPIPYSSNLHIKLM